MRSKNIFLKPEKGKYNNEKKPSIVFVLCQRNTKESPIVKAKRYSRYSWLVDEG